MRFIRLLMLLLALISVSLATFPEGRASTGVSVVKSVRLRSDLAHLSAGASLPLQDRLSLATQVLKEHIVSLLEIEPSDIARKDFDPWLATTIKNRFDAYLPAWSVVVKEPGVASVQLTFATDLFLNDLRASKFSKLETSSQASRSIDSLVIESVVIDESGRKPYFLLEPSKSKNLEHDTNSTSLPLNARPSTYAQFALSKMNIKYSTDVQWSKNVTAWVSEYLQKQAQNAPCPIRELLESSSLAQSEKVVLFFCVPSEGTLSLVHQMDFVYFGKKGPVRGYWSRSLHDPQHQLSNAEAMTLAISKFTQSLKRAQTGSEKRQASLSVSMDRRLQEKEIMEISNLLRGFTLRQDHVLEPQGVNADRILFFTTIPLSKLELVLNELKQRFQSLVVASDMDRKTISISLAK